MATPIPTPSPHPQKPGLAQGFKKDCASHLVVPHLANPVGGGLRSRPSWGMTNRAVPKLASETHIKIDLSTVIIPIPMTIS